MIKVIFFAQVRELVGVRELSLPAQFQTAEQLRQFLIQKGENWRLALSQQRLLVAINQKICSLDTTIQSGDEVAFFPPVTGG